MVYHGCSTAQELGEAGVYCAGVVLLDRDNPARVLRRGGGPILRPVADFERRGFVPNVVFPTALIDCGPTLTAYYGAADTAVGSAEFSRNELIASLNRH